jgi:hypothetical protein
MRNRQLPRRLIQLGGAVALITAVTAAAGPAFGSVSGVSMPPPVQGTHPTVPSGATTSSTAASTTAASGRVGAAMSTSAMPDMGPAAGAGGNVLAGQLSAMRTATAKYATNLGAAKADGYQIITKMMPNMGFHFLNPKIAGFSARKPQILVYEHLAGRWQLGALEWVFTKMPVKTPLPNATFGLFPAACHYADGTFVQDKNAKTCAKTAPHTGAKFTFWHPDLITMHVWVWYPNPAGLFASTNPLIAPFGRG